MASANTSEPNAKQRGHENAEFEFYDTLQPGQIRLLKIKSIQELSFKFEIVSLAKCPPYGCLSYVWGDSTLCEQIKLQGQPFWITRSLFIALDQFRKGIDSKTVNPFKKYLWIDAACINQGHSEQAKIERNDQVQRMTEIYENAEKVYAWLGPTKEEWRIGLAGAKLAHLEVSYQHEQRTATRKPSHTNWDQSSELGDIIRRLGMAEAEGWSRPETRTKDAWLGIIEMWKSEWWTRAWAYQEGTVPELNVVFSRRYERVMTPPKPVETKIVFIAGKAHTSWYAMGVALGTTTFILSSTAPGTDILKGSAASFSKLSHIRQLRGINMKSIDWSNPIDVVNRHYLINKKSLLADPTILDPLDILNKFRTADCKDPRDKVFAAIGMLPDLRSKITVDYRRSTLETYLEVIAKILSAPDASLEFLGYACKTHNGLDFMDKKRPDIEWDRFPTWLPNWFCPMDLTPLPKTLYVQAPTERRIFRDRWKMGKGNTSSLVSTYLACGRHTIHNAVISGNLLHTPGWELDDISDVMRFNLPKSEQTAVLTRWKTHLSKSTYPDGEVFDRDLRRVHCADVKYATTPALKPVSRGYEIVNTVLQADKAALDEKQLPEQANMQSTLTLMTRNRALCMTKKGRLGLVPYCSLAGDKVISVFGGQVLYVLRQRGMVEDRHEYIGEAYVHGLMDGEVSDMADRGEISTQVFTLD